VKKLKVELYEIIAYHSGQPLEKVKEDSDRDFWMTAPEAKEYGLVDEVLLINPRKIKES
jgi:ATP-dependent Clp protease protease subunit